MEYSTGVLEKCVPSVILRSSATRVGALAFVAVAAACGSDPTAQPEVNLESLTLTAETTGNDVMDRVSEAEGECLRTEIGGAAYEAFLGGERRTAYGEVGDLDSLFACLTPDNFVVFGIASTAARAGVTDDTHACLTDLGREHPDAVVTLLGIETPPEAVAALIVETHPYTIELVVPHFRGVGLFELWCD